MKELDQLHSVDSGHDDIDYRDIEHVSGCSFNNLQGSSRATPHEGVHAVSEVAQEFVQVFENRNLVVHHKNLQRGLSRLRLTN